MENLQASNNSDVFLGNLSNDFETCAVHLYPICTLWLLLRTPPVDKLFINFIFPFTECDRYYFSAIYKFNSCFSKEKIHKIPLSKGTHKIWSCNQNTKEFRVHFVKENNLNNFYHLSLNCHTVLSEVFPDK